MIRRPSIVLTLALSTFAGAATLCANEGATRIADQGWSQEQIDFWSYATQGSRLLPYSWFIALERPNGPGAFSDLNFLETFGYLPPPRGLAGERPLGFAIDEQNDRGLKATKLRWFKGQGSTEGWLGFNCAACHTAQIDTSKGSVQILGAPGSGDIQRFVAAVNASLRSTLDERSRFDRFAAKVLKGKDTRSNRRRLRTALRKLIAYQETIQSLNEVDHAYGYGRVDAFGYISNKALLTANPAIIKGNRPTAPVSYPYLWDIRSQHRIQYNGIAENKPTVLPDGRGADSGALIRNAGEVVGVFGEVVGRKAGLSGYPNYKSSIRVDYLNNMENLLANLKPPRWKDVFGTPPEATSNARMLAEGKRLFGQSCASCHRPREQWADAASVEVIVPLKAMMADGNITDTAMACNVWGYSGPTGMLRGTREDLRSSVRHGDHASAVALVKTLVAGSLLNQNAATSAADGIAPHRPGRGAVIERPSVPATAGAPEMQPANDEMKCIDATFVGKDGKRRPVNGYKAKPLDGIFATAPYLHNGSVPTLYHLLLPPADRPTAFWIGSRKFDADYVGFQWRSPDDGRAFLFRVNDENGRPIKGNSNAGHVYGVDRLTDIQRASLLEYLKTL